MWTTGPSEWWVSASPLCCYCTSGSPPQLYLAPSPLGPYAAAGALGNAARGQQNFVFTHPRLPGGQVLTAFSRWGSDPGPAPPLFDYSLQFWTVLQRAAGGGGWEPVEWSDTATLLVDV